MLGSVVGFATLATIPVPDVTETLVTLPPPLGSTNTALVSKFSVIPLIVIVLVSGTGTYPNTASISRFVIGAAPVTNPLALTLNFKKVLFV